MYIYIGTQGRSGTGGQQTGLSSHRYFLLVLVECFIKTPFILYMHLFIEVGQARYHCIMWYNASFLFNFIQSATY